MKRELTELYDHVLDCVDPKKAISKAAADGHFDFVGTGPLLVIAFGKSARRMANQLIHELPDLPIRGLIVPPEGDTAPLPPFEIIAGGHPLPTTGSLLAGKRALELARSVARDETILFLVSGGGSAMLELPVDDRVTIDELRSLNQSLIGSGANIGEINTVRRQLSALKGGKLAMAGSAAKAQRTLVISDVPKDTPAAAIASGPTVADPSTIVECRSVLDRYNIWPSVPAALQDRIERDDLPLSMPAEHELAQRSKLIQLLGEHDALDAASLAATRLGWLVDSDCSVDDWPYADAAMHLLERLKNLRQAHPNKPVAVLTTGELSVPLPAAPGIGGRNLQFALFCAKLIEGENIHILSCGTDGIDGNSPAAGGIVNGTTIRRAKAVGQDADDALTRCDAFTLLDAIGDCLKPGPTGSNVRDLRILVSGI
ncbi:DUF4147 domain-containing protein [bacterium]|nr:DUF4147 domain-containing protein [bacterium]